MTTDTPTATIRSATWLPAAPVRAHVRSVIAETQTPWQVIALLADVPIANVQTLLFGRAGTLRPRLSPGASARLQRVTSAVVRDSRRTLVPSREARPSVRLLTAAGWSLDEIADAVGIDAAHTARIAHGRGGCSVYTALVAHALCVEAGLTQADEAELVA